MPPGDLAHQPLPVGLEAHVLGDEGGLAAERLSNRRARRLVAVGDRDDGAFLGEALGGGAADSAAGAGDDRHFVLYTAHVFPSLVFDAGVARSAQVPLSSRPARLRALSRKVSFLKRHNSWRRTSKRNRIASTTEPVSP